MHALLQHDWPGNIRELENAIKSAIAFADGPIIRRDDLPETLSPGSATSEPGLHAHRHRATAPHLDRRPGRPGRARVLRAAALGVSRQRRAMRPPQRPVTPERDPEAPEVRHWTAASSSVDRRGRQRASRRTVSRRRPPAGQLWSVRSKQLVDFRVARWPLDAARGRPRHRARPRPTRASAEPSSTSPRTHERQGPAACGPCRPHVDRRPALDQEPHGPVPGAPGRDVKCRAVLGDVEIAVAFPVQRRDVHAQVEKQPSAVRIAVSRKLGEQRPTLRQDLANELGLVWAIEWTVAPSFRAQAAISCSTPWSSIGMPRRSNSPSTSPRPLRAAIAIADLPSRPPGAPGRPRGRASPR